MSQALSLHARLDTSLIWRSTTALREQKSCYVLILCQVLFQIKVLTYSDVSESLQHGYLPAKDDKVLVDGVFLCSLTILA